MTDSPTIAVIVASYNAASTIRGCLGSLARQLRPGCEVFVVDSSTDGTAEIVRREFPFARLIRSETRLAPGAARNRGVGAARADVIAFVDTDCIPPSNWVETLREAHRETTAVAIGGAVEAAAPETVVGWGAYFCEFSAWMPAGGRRVMNDIPTCNLSYKRWVLERFGPFRETGYSSDTALNWRLAAAGHGLLFLPDLKVAHINLKNLGRFVRKQIMHGEAFARMRCSERALPPSVRAGFATGCAVLPPILLARIVRRVARTSLWKPYLLSLPVTIVGLIAWSCGEAAGYAKGR